MNVRSVKLFFLELIIVLFSFTLCSFVCVQIFANAYLVSQQSRETSEAVVKAQATAEAFKADNLESLGLQQPDAQQGTFVLYFDPAWNALKSPASRKLTMVVTHNGSLESAHITISIEGTNLFSLTACRQEESSTP
jgi:hypothetical protein